MYSVLGTPYMAMLKWLGGRWRADKAARPKGEKQINTKPHLTLSRGFETRHGVSSHHPSMVEEVDLAADEVEVGGELMGGGKTSVECTARHSSRKGING